MKCVMKGEEVKKVSNEQAMKMVKNGWNYCAKKFWKEKVRDKNKKVEKIGQPNKEKEVKVENKRTRRPGKTKKIIEEVKE